MSHLADELQAQLIIVAAEVQARADLREALPKRHREILVETRTGGRADGVDEAALEAEVRLIVEDYAGRRSRRGWTGSRPNWAGTAGWRCRDWRP
ncbi:hypothetical protein GCM10018954_101750 [Kutzneria kofuensis]